MRKYTVHGLITLVIILVSYSDSPAYVFEAHPGLRLAYEYSDNANGSANDPQSDNIYEIGPSLILFWNTPTVRTELRGYITRAEHKRFDQDDSTEANVSALMGITGIRQSLDIDYSYLQTTRRETLTIPAGLSKTDSVGVSYMRMMTQYLTLNLFYDYDNRREPSGGENEVSHRGRTLITYQLTPRNSFDLTYEYDDFRYDIDPDAQVMTTGIAWRNLWSQRMSVGVRSNYTKNERKSFPDEFIYSLMPTVTYNLTQHTTLNLAAGENWFITEHEDRESSYTLDGSLEYAALHDRAAINVFRGYEAQFTSNLYGIYETKSVTVTLQKEIVETLAGIIDLSIIRTTPAFDIPAITPPDFNVSTQEETDTFGRATLQWDPNKYMTLSAIYEHLLHEFEISDTERENRYRMVLEVRY